MEKINVAELLKDCHHGMELDCMIYEDVYFDYVDELNIIHCYIQYETHKTSITFNQHGTPNSNIKSKCVIFPKGKTTWEGFQRPIEDGDIVAFDSKDGAYLFIFKEYIYDNNYAQCYMMLNCNGDIDFESGCYFVERLATKEEKEKLFKAIKEHGYRWNEETKTLEELIKPKFKVGDRIVHKKNSVCVPILITNVSDEFYYSNTESSVGILSISEQDEYELVPTIVPKFKVGDRIRNKKTLDAHTIHSIYEDSYCFGLKYIWICDQDDWELAPNKFDINTLVPFESRVLIRDTRSQKWSPAIWGFYNSDHQDYQYKLVGVIARYCIPYEGNEHLLGTSNDCDDYFKTWK